MAAPAPGLVALGTIVRLQVQVAPLKRGEKPARWYDPARIREMSSLMVTRDGVVGTAANGERVRDVHHVDHPDSRSWGLASGLSLGFTSHYGRMRARFGDHLADGVAGENILVACDEVVTLDRLGGEVVLAPGEGRDAATARLDQVEVAEPCVEFSRFAAQVGAGDEASLTDTLRFLRAGTRGFYLVLATPDRVEIAVGDRVLVSVAL